MSKTIHDKNEARDPAAPGLDLTSKSRSEAVAAHSPSRSRSRTAIVAIVAVVAIGTIGILAWAYWQSGSGGAGRPVPTPRSGAEEPRATASSSSIEGTISLEPEAVARAEIKTEPVGEALVAGSSVSGQATTGIVQANAYRTTPVVSLVGGIVRRITAELGQNVSQGGIQ